MAKHSKRKGGFKLYHFAILICIILMGAALYIILDPECIEYFVKPDTQMTSNGMEVIKTKIMPTQEISEEDARKAASSQFRLLGETNIRAKDLKLKKIEREQVEYYYITSTKNTLEMSVIGGNITRINSKVVGEVSKTNEPNQINGIDQTNQLDKINEINQMNQIGEVNQINQLNIVNQINQINHVN